MKKLKLILPIAGTSMLAATAGVLTSCGCSNNSNVINWPGKMVGEQDAWAAYSNQKLKIESGKQYSVEFDWTECGAKLSEEHDTVMVALGDNIDHDPTESYDFTGSTYKLEAYNTNTNKWDTIEGLEPDETGGVKSLVSTAETAGHNPWQPEYYKKGCRFTFTAKNSSIKELLIYIYISND